MQKILFIGTVWSEPESTAAGKRILQLIEQFQSNNFEVFFASAAVFGEFSFDLKSINVTTFPINLNDSDFDEIITKLNPDFVVFDRFMTEEQYGWRVAENCPRAIKILDTEDLHFVRNTRFENFKSKKNTENSDFLNSDLAKREIASIYRCDVSLIISEVEMEILTNIFKIDSKILLYLPFLLDEINENNFEDFPSFAERQNFISIGNFRHEPNWNTVLYLKETIWPIISSKLHNAEMHIYGSYVTQKAMQLNNPKERFFIKGRAEDARKVIANARVLLAPIRFGAGIKGKLTDAMQFGTPSVTTSIGAESMCGNFAWNGQIADNENDFANAAIELYLNENIWKTAQSNAIDIVNNRFSKKVFGTILISTILEIKSNLNNHRTSNFLGNLLQHQTLNSNKYFSKWIEEKNKKIL